MKTFLSNMKKYDIKYALGFVVWSVLEKLSEIPKVKSFYRIYRIQNSMERLLDQYDEHLQQFFPLNTDEERITTPCGCTYFNDCSECSSHSVCNTYEN